MRKKKENPEVLRDEPVSVQPETINTKNPETESKVQDASRGPEEKSENKEIEELRQKLTESQDKYLRLSAEFDNYRKRTLKERIELTKTAGEEILAGFLPLMDDFDRARLAMQNAQDMEALREGLDLIYKKMSDFLSREGIQEIPAIGESFSTDWHEAITKIPAPEASQKGKIVDVIQKGYFLHEKVIRFAKVVIGE